MSFLYDRTGQRKYLTVAERQRFLKAARLARPEVYTFCATLAYTGARISEVLALVPARLDANDNLVIVPCLKKRRPGISRAVPVPASLIAELEKVHSIGRTSPTNGQTRLWPWSRTTAWKYVKTVMAKAGLEGPSASPKGLRHSFGVCSLQSNAPINMVRKWLGHSKISTTAIYADAVGDEERDIAEKFWETFSI